MADDRGSSSSTRGSGFPTLGLPDAVEIVSIAGAYSRSFGAEALASYAGHSTSNSGAFRSKVASLRDWGLIESTAGDNFALTSRALSVVYPESPQELQSALQAAFLGFSLFEAIYSNAAKGVALSRSQIGNQAVTTYWVGIPNKDKFVRSFVESAIFAGLASPSGSDGVILGPPERPNSASTPESSIVAGRSAVRSASSTSGAIEPANPRLMHQTWPFKNGAVVFSIEGRGSLPSSAFMSLPRVIESIESLVEKLEATTEPDDVISLKADE